VAELLILRADMPRSLARCMKEVYSNLTRVANSRSAETERLAGELESHLRFGGSSGSSKAVSASTSRTSATVSSIWAADLR
jgi:uncharacterized alpha-E superfamily protein